MAAVLLCAVTLPAAAQWTWTPQTGRWINLKRLPKETAELQIEYARSLMLEGEYTKALRETGKFDDFYGDSELADENQFLRGEIYYAQGKYLKAAREYQALIANFPDSELYDEVIEKQYQIGDRFFEDGQKKVEKPWYYPFRKRPIRQAIEVYGMVIDNQPFTAEAAEAQYKVGRCHYVMDEYIEAAYEYQRVIEDYAQSDWVDDASYGLAVCYYDGSLSPAYDQTPSVLAVRAIDEFHARFPADSRGEELTGMRVEMRERIAQQRLMTARYYEKRRKFESAEIYYKVVVEQFPDTEAAVTAEAWLEARAANRLEIQSES